MSENVNNLRHRNPQQNQNSHPNGNSQPSFPPNNNSTETREERLSRRKKYLSWAIGVFAIFYASYYLQLSEKNNVKISSVLKYTTDNTLEDSKMSFGVPLHMISSLKTLGPDVTDKLFKVSEKCVRLRRNVQMYQWEEHQTTHSDDEGNSYTETYHTKVWAGYRLHTTSFFYSNPEFEIQNAVFSSNGTGLESGVTLSKVFNDQINWKVKKSGPTFENWNYYSRNLFGSSDAALVPQVGEDTERKGSWIWDNYNIGDYRVYWECLGENGDQVSVLGVVNDETKLLEKFSVDENSPAIALLEKGGYSRIKLINRAFRKHKRTSWYWRILFTLLITAGVVLLWEIVLEVCGNVYFLRNMMRGRAGVVVFAGFISSSLSIVIISSCWLKVQPIIACLGICLVLFPWINIFVRFRRNRL